MELLLQLVVQGIVVGSLYALVALGFVLIYKSSDVINLAQGEFLLLGAYIGLVFAGSLQVPFLLAVLLSLAAAFGTGLLVERLVLRPFIGEPAISVIMATLGLSMIIRSLIHMIWGTAPRSYPPVFSQEPIQLAAGPYRVLVSEAHLWTLAAAVILLVALTAFFRYSITGIAMRASADDQQAALSMGISVKRVLAVTWGVAAMVSGLGGVMLGNMNGITPILSSYGLKVLPVAILGGLDSIPGAIAGGFVIGILENLAGGYLDPLVPGGGVKEVAPFAFLLLVLLIRPYGLFGKEIIERV
ncbi:branched-chain amino acid ABC transporter permease [Caldinitratiruptor microaerophilus]|uniref:Branched-chain amino acid ABC transporter permease n=1 Tax=Caldinitratiruptor microaerophilus TaxID=671077 RepID=A0AA35CPA4_9FIRM|nr:branched-chain amino acid ABC transporter permease [Caldinitratiruptor microaerophilus]BDG61437.1 branched-chain amino acid ABC transporter permease [Caldinitratiruptor microaerophilus]